MISPAGWLSPTGVVHAGVMLSMTTPCGVRVGPIGSGWSATVDDVTCQRCIHVLAPRPTRVSVGHDGQREEES